MDRGRDAHGIVDLVLGLRVKADEEELGLDLAVHGEVAYQTS